MTIKVHINNSSLFYPATKTQIKEVIYHLRDLANGDVKPLDKTLGICRELRFRLAVNSHSLRCHIDTWPKLDRAKGCDFIYPIKDKKGNYWATTSDYPHTSTSMWDNRTTVGKLRRELCTHIATCLQEELDAGVYEDE